MITILIITTAHDSNGFLASVAQSSVTVATREEAEAMINRLDGINIKSGIVIQAAIIGDSIADLRRRSRGYQDD